jgi:hypothetical protein
MEKTCPAAYDTLCCIKYEYSDEESRSVWTKCLGNDKNKLVSTKLVLTFGQMKSQLLPIDLKKN